jgi:hypothetical protein
LFTDRDGAAATIFIIGDRINIFKQERKMALQENERLVREQNIVLEQQVAERTTVSSQRGCRNS